MKSPFTCSSLGLILACCFPLAAQQPSPAEQQRAMTLSVQQAHERQISSIQFDDLPLNEVIQSLRKHFPEINFILPETLDQIIVRLELRNVTLDDIVQAIEIAGRNDGLVINKENDRLYSIEQNPRAAARPASQPTLRAYNLTGYLGDRPLKDQGDAVEMIYSLVSDAVGLLGKAGNSVEMPRLQMHEGTRTLLVVGTPDQLRVLDEVIGNLPGMGSRPVLGGGAIDAATGALIAPNPAVLPAGSRPAERQYQYDEKFLKRYGLDHSGNTSTGR